MSRATLSHGYASRWGPRLLAFGFGAMAALLVLADDIASWWALRAEALSASEHAASATALATPQAGAVAQASSAATAVTAAASATWSAPPSGLNWLPVLQAHGLHLQALQHSPAAAGGSPELSLTVQGRWRDWLALERQASGLLVGWLPQSWQVQALGPPAPQGQVQLQWRLRPSGAAAPALGSEPEAVAPEEMPRHASTGAEVFAAAAAWAEASAPNSWQATQAVPTKAKPSWRLLGVWQQAGVAHALVEGEGQVQTLRPGQALGRSGLRVQRIEDGQVWLHGGQASRAARPWPLGSAP